MLEMDDKIAFSEFAEIDLGAVTFHATQPQNPSRMNCESSEQLRSRKDYEISCRKTKSARKRALDEIDPMQARRAAIWLKWLGRPAPSRCLVS